MTDTRDHKLQVNDADHSVDARGAETLLTTLRDRLGLTGTKRGCNQGVCGACTVLIDGEPVRSCLTLTATCPGRDITTIEGLAPRDAMSPIQQAFVDKSAVQCGFCTSGMILSAHSLLQKNADPTVDEIRTALSGNLCRCSGYKKIVDAIAEAASKGNAP